MADFVRAVEQPDGTFRARRFKAVHHLQRRGYEERHPETGEVLREAHDYETVSQHDNDEEAHAARNKLDPEGHHTRVWVEILEVGDE